MGILHAHFLLASPSSLLDSLVTPQNFDQRHGFVSQFLLFKVQNLNRPLLVTQVLHQLHWLILQDVTPHREHTSSNMTRGKHYEFCLTTEVKPICRLRFQLFPKSRMVQYISDSTFLSFQTSSPFSKTIPSEIPCPQPRMTSLLDVYRHIFFVDPEQSSDVDESFGFAPKNSLPNQHHKFFVLLPRSNILVSYISYHIRPQTVPYQYWHDNCCCRRTRPWIALQIGAANQHLMGWVPPSSTKEPVSASLPVSVSGNTQQGSTLTMQPNMWSNVLGLPNLFSTQPQKTASNVSQSFQANVLESSSSAPRREAEHDVVSDCFSPSVSGASSMNYDSPAQKDFTKNLNSEKDTSQGTESVSCNLTDGSPTRSAITQKNIEAFGRSLVSNNLSHQQFSLLNQMQAMKSSEPDTNGRALKKMKGLEGSFEGPKLNPNAASINEGLQSLTSSAVLSFSGLADNTERETSGQLGNVSSQNIIAPGQDVFRTNLHGNNPAFPKVDHPHISPQMTPSWFNHYGTFRNGQMLAINDTFPGTIPKTAEQLSTLGKSSSGLHTLNSIEQVAAAAVDPGQHLNIPQSSTVAMEPQSLHLNVSRPKKRKRQAFCYISWHKEVSHKSQTTLTIRMAEEVWAKAVNRIPEKIEDEVDLSGNGPISRRAKRRLNLTTQLMQQLLCPPPPIILSSDAQSAYESVTYSVSRSALGEACGLVYHPSSDSDTSHDVEKLFSDKKSEKVNDRHLSMVIGDFRGRARNIEAEFFRLEKRLSLVDLRVECQELEKFSVINRFAKFHGRGQFETVNTSSSDMATKAPRPHLQRYVTALPVPRRLPDSVHCLPL